MRPFFGVSMDRSADTLPAHQPVANQRSFTTRSPESFSPGTSLRISLLRSCTAARRHSDDGTRSSWPAPMGGCQIGPGCRCLAVPTPRCGRGLSWPGICELLAGDFPIARSGYRVFARNRLRLTGRCSAPAYTIRPRATDEASRDRLRLQKHCVSSVTFTKGCAKLSL